MLLPSSEFGEEFLTVMYQMDVHNALSVDEIAMRADHATDPSEPINYGVREIR